MDDWMQPASRGELPRREAMQTPEEVAAMLRLKALDPTSTVPQKKRGGCNRLRQ
jgi:hypothetical protein